MLPCLTKIVPLSLPVILVLISIWTKNERDENLLSSAVLDFFHSADHVCANVEGALIEATDTGEKGVLFHSMNPKAAQVFKKMQADIWSLGRVSRAVYDEQVKL